MEKRDLSEFSKDVSYLKERKADFITMTGTYSCTIKSEFGTVMYCKEQRGWGALHARNSMQKDLERYINDFKTNSTNLTYNMFNKKYESVDIDEVDKVDIKSAYFTALVRTGKISEKTKDFMAALPKPERLSSVGMLAYEPLITTYTDGEVKNPELDMQTRKSKYRDVFFYCVSEVSKAMSEVMHELGEEFIFFWVDGIYFKSGYKNRKKVMDILDRYSYEYSYELVKNFHVEHDHERIKLKYNEDKREVNDPTEFCFPHPDVQKKRNMMVLVDEFRRGDMKAGKKLLRDFFVLDEKDRIIF